MMQARRQKKDFVGVRFSLAPRVFSV